MKTHLAWNSLRATAMTALLTSVASSSPQGGNMSLEYRMKAGETVKYRIQADIKGSMPILDSPTPIDLSAMLKMDYAATPKARLGDSDIDVEFKVENAEAELEHIPFPIPEDQAKDILNLTATFKKTGEVVKVKSDKPVPFGLSIPGVDPKRFFAMLFPVVFPANGIKAGAKWNFAGHLLGSESVTPKFEATVPITDKPIPDQIQLDIKFSMPVERRIDKDKKTVETSVQAHRLQKGLVDGDGTYQFDTKLGRITSGKVNIRASIDDTLLATPISPDEQKLVKTTVKAVVTVSLAPATTKSEAPKEKKP